MTDQPMSEASETLWQSTRRRIAIGSFRFLVGVTSVLLLYGLFYPNGVETLEAMKEIIYTVGGVFSLIVTGYMGVDLVSRMRAKRVENK